MSWTLRHQGSPKEVPNLTVAQIVAGLQEGQCDVTDEVKGPHDTAWWPIEEHPQLAEIVAELTPEERVHDEGETHLDMNALIDVTLVLLIFFILTTSYDVLEKVLEMPRTKSEDANAIKVVAQEQVDNFMIRVKARQEAEKAAIWVEDQLVPEGKLQEVLTKLARQSHKSEVLLDAAGVEYGTVIKIIDAAGGAKIAHVHFLFKPG